MGLFFPLIDDFEPGWRNRQASTEGTLAWSAQPVPLFKYKVAIEATGRFHDEALRPGGSSDVLKVIQGFFFFNMEAL